MYTDTDNLQDAPVGPATTVPPGVPASPNEAHSLNRTRVTERPGTPISASQAVPDPLQEAENRLTETVRRSARDIRRLSLAAIDFGDTQALLDLYVTSPSVVGSAMKGVWKDRKRIKGQKEDARRRLLARDAREEAAKQCDVELKNDPGAADDFEDGSGDYIRVDDSLDNSADGMKPVDVKPAARPHEPWQGHK